MQNRQFYEKIKAKNSLTKHSESKQTASDNKTCESASIPESSDGDSPKTSAVNQSKTSKQRELEEEQRYIIASKECDHKNVFRTIERDVIRTFPDMEFFRQTEMQGLLIDVLYNFACENPHLSYKQGMHELLAALLYVLHTDSQICLINREANYANETIATLLDPKYLEHDVHQLFCALMKFIETWYQNDDILTVPAPSTNNNGVINRSSRQSIGSVLGIKLKKISENIVRNYDLELFNHLEALQIAPQIYGIRWMRLLFGREFEFRKLLTVWDAMICDHVPMSLSDYIFASMLITIREELVNGDYTDCLNNLMRHQFKDVQYVIKLALHLRDPENNVRPQTIHKIGAQRQPAGVKSRADRYSSEASLTSKLSQQYITDKSKLKQQTNYLPTSNQNVYGGRYISNIDNRSEMLRGSNSIVANSNFKLSGRQRFEYQSNSIAEAASSGIRFLTQASKSAGPFSSSKNKFLPNINKFVSSMSQNIQDKTNQSQSTSAKSYPSNQMSKNAQFQVWSASSSGSSHNNLADQSATKRQYPHRSSDQLLLTPSPLVKEYEMREMQSTGSTSRNQDHKASRASLNSIRRSESALNLSTESYDDIHSIVDYCWRLLSEQIDSLQRCLSKEKDLTSEDEILVSLAQLKKVRDVLKGSLRLEDELESPVGGGKP